jgi:hypothetical protein
VVQKGVQVLGATQHLVGDDEAVVGGPGVHAKAAFLSAPSDELARHHLEAQTEAALHLGLPLEGDGGWTRDEHEVGLLAEQQLLKHQARLDGLAETHVVRDEQVGAREFEGLHQRRQLMVHDLDARSKRRLEAVRVRRADGAPLQCVQVRTKVPRRVERRTRGRLAGLARSDVLDQPLAMTCPDDLSRSGETVPVMVGGRRRGALRVEACCEREPFEQITPRRRVVGDAVRAADDLKLFAAELSQDERSATLELTAQERRELALVRRGACAEANAEEAREVEDPRLRERSQDRHGGRCRGRRGARLGHL